MSSTAAASAASTAAWCSGGIRCVPVRCCCLRIISSARSACASARHVSRSDSASSSLCLSMTRCRSAVCACHGATAGTMRCDGGSRPSIVAMRCEAEAFSPSVGPPDGVMKSGSYGRPTSPIRAIRSARASRASSSVHSLGSSSACC